MRWLWALSIGFTVGIIFGIQATLIDIRTDLRAFKDQIGVICQ
jgi:hypothetical protein